MKILDRYIGAAVALAFLSGVTMFMVLLCAMNLLKDLIKLIKQDGFPTGTALLVSAYRIPGLLLYAFPMAVLLGILLTFGRMSGESEMVAIQGPAPRTARRHQQSGLTESVNGSLRRQTEHTQKGKATGNVN